MTRKTSLFAPALLPLWTAALLGMPGLPAAEPPPPEAPDAPVPDYSGYQQCYRIPFANRKPVDFEHLESLSVRVTLNGGPPIRLQVDTGSAGVIVGASDVPQIDPQAPAGSITYSSSGVELLGVWTPVTLTFPDSRDAQGNVATAVIPVLAVSERKVHAGAVNSGRFKPSLNPKVYMLGIGTGRGKQPHQERNPWVNLKEMQAGTMRRGYTITREGITLGLTGAAVGSGYLYEKLNEHRGTEPGPVLTPPAPKDWDSALGWVTVGDVRSATAGMLLDTGLTNMMIQVPDPAFRGDVPDGTEITVYLLSGRLSYRFRVGDFTNPVTPRRVTWVRRTPTPLINTGLRALALYDYLYDGDGGYFGLRPLARP